MDTNVLLRSMHPQHPHYALAQGALATLRSQGKTLCVAPQNLVEFWAVATRPLSENGLGMSVTRATAEVATLSRFFQILRYNVDVLEGWRSLVSTQGVIGKQAHDAHLVAIMRVHSVASILTFNRTHFERFPGITTLTPENV